MKQHKLIPLGAVLRSLDACEPSLAKLMESAKPTFKELWAAWDHGPWMIWLIEHDDLLPLMWNGDSTRCWDTCDKIYETERMLALGVNVPHYYQRLANAVREHVTAEQVEQALYRYAKKHRIKAR